jgi:3'-phosphoadenosine 5'-phosphosulfate sulfotransferase (PAPS reductase)/FAD synthetase
MKLTHWLSYGGGVNSTALLIALIDGRVKAEPWRVLFSDTMDEKDETYAYTYGVLMPYLRQQGRSLEIVRPAEGVLERAERLSVTLSRTLRTCTVEAKIMPINRHIKAHGSPDDVQLIGIDAGEAHRANHETRPGDLAKRYPLLELDWDRDDCVEVIKAAGLPVPPKSGCWHCPFMRKAEVISLAINMPDRFGRIVKLEDAANREHPSDDGRPRTQWGDRPAREWARLACDSKSSGELFQGVDPDPPCACYDGG